MMALMLSRKSYMIVCVWGGGGAGGRTEEVPSQKCLANVWCSGVGSGGGGGGEGGKGAPPPSQTFWGM